MHYNEAYNIFNGGWSYGKKIEQDLLSRSCR